MCEITTVKTCGEQFVVSARFVFSASYSIQSQAGNSVQCRVEEEEEGEKGEQGEEEEEEGEEEGELNAKHCFL